MPRPPPRRPGPPQRPPRDEAPPHRGRERREPRPGRPPAEAGAPPQGRERRDARPGRPPAEASAAPRGHDRRGMRDARPPREEAAEPAPAPRGRDRRGMGDVRAPRATDAAPASRPRPAGPREAPPPNSLWLHGLHAVAAALANPKRRLKRLLVTEEAEAELARRLPKPWRVTAERADRQRFQTFLPEDSVHQGAALLAEFLQPVPLEDAISASAGPVLILDQVTDPRNVGAILRSAAAFGAACVVMQDRHAPPETGALARAASGALETLPVAREVNLSRAILGLQRAGFWVLGLAGEGARTLADAVPRDRRVALVLGAEDAGLRRLQRETCDELVRLPIAPGVESLNVAAAAAVALYEIARGALEDSTP